MIRRRGSETVDASGDAPDSIGGDIAQAAVEGARGRAGGRYLMLLAIGAVLALALSEPLRARLLDVMFGAEEEFDYVSTTTPASPAPSGAGAA